MCRGNVGERRHSGPANLGAVAYIPTNGRGSHPGHSMVTDYFIARGCSSPRTLLKLVAFFSQRERGKKKKNLVSESVRFLPERPAAWDACCKNGTNLLKLIWPVVVVVVVVEPADLDVAVDFVDGEADVCFGGVAAAARAESTSILAQDGDRGQVVLFLFCFFFFACRTGSRARMLKVAAGVASKSSSSCRRGTSTDPAGAPVVSRHRAPPLIVRARLGQNPANGSRSLVPCNCTILAGVLERDRETARLHRCVRNHGVRRNLERLAER